ncbi:hypothetical protein LBW89_20570 [Paenibacillus sp. alder61]|uniref:Uncharacterized protein n=1 Tax=Paenibacillus faecis TaxID=862114 RepID=A0A5D0CX47_9BACL|nr:MULTISPECIES: hypothetical protein [Paenibacillus]MCA1295405.1 hypothetical protein [Paenibacillus sp. alder61]TYA14521.1 hypothetical protein FRY98_02205 [Paenibacillus faecis]
MVIDTLSETIEKLKEAQKNLERIRSTYKDNSELLNIYEPSAKYLVDSMKDRLNELLNEEVDLKLSQPDKDVDLWIRINGEDFQSGKGPIGLVGNFLSKLSNANRQSLNLIAKARNIDIKSITNEFPLSFDLTTTATGSLKLGLKSPNLKVDIDDEQLDMFSYNKDPWEKLRELATQNEMAVESMQLLLSALASAEDEEILSGLVEKYNERDVLKIIHYAKQVTPSSQSNIDAISFEGNSVTFRQRIVNTTKHTRKQLSKQAKKLVNKEFVHGKGKVRGVDLDDKSLIIRPFVFEDVKHDEIRCYLLNDDGEQSLERFLKKRVKVSGFVVYSSNNKLLRLEAEEITVE